MKFEKVLIAVPARFQSSRLPGKVLCDIGGEPMLKKVLDNCKRAISREFIFVCTDSEEIFKKVELWGYKAYITDKSCSSGSERIASKIKELIYSVWSLKSCKLDDEEYNKKIDKTFIINVQGDQPFIDPNLIKEMIFEATKSKNEFDVITPIYKLKSEDIHNPNVVKVLLGVNNQIIYFSRYPLPYQRDNAPSNWHNKKDYWGHVGIYGYKANVLNKWEKMQKSSLEECEKLEQLRLLDNQFRFKSFPVKGDFLSVDTYAQLQKARLHYQSYNKN